MHLSVPEKHIFIDLDHDFQQMAVKIPDFTIIDDNTCVLIEVKTSLLNIAARTYFEMDRLETEVKAGNIKKALTQVTEFKNIFREGKIADSRFKGTKVICIIVGYEDIFCLNSTLLPILDSTHGVELRDFQFACISDIEALGSAIEQGLHVVQALFKKTNNVGERQWAIATLFNNEIDRENMILDDAFDEFIIRMGVPRFSSKTS